MKSEPMELQRNMEESRRLEIVRTKRKGHIPPTSEKILRQPNLKEIEGVLSVNGYTGEVWYHTWHGPFIGMKELE